MPYILGDVLPSESLLNEYKEFTGEITPDNFFSDEEIYNMIENNFKPDYKKFKQ